MTVVGVLPDAPAARRPARADARAARRRARARRARRRTSGRPRRRSTAASATASPRSRRDRRLPRAQRLIALPSSRRRASASSRRTRRSKPSRRSTSASPSRRPGMFARTRDVVGGAARSPIPEWRRGGGGELHCALLEIDGGPAGLRALPASTRVRDGVSTGTSSVIEAIGATSRARRARSGATCSTSTGWTRVEAELLPVDHPLLFLLAASRGGCASARRRALGPARRRRRRAVRAHVRRRDAVVLEVATTSARGTRAGGGSGRGAVERTGDGPDLRLDVSALGLGLPRRLHLRAARPGAAASRSWTGRDRARGRDLPRPSAHPWCPEIF